MAGVARVMLLWLVLLPLTVRAQDDGFELTILHTNDIHAHHEPNGDGHGGAARMATVIAALRDEAEHVLLLDAGDRFSGTLFHQQYRGADNVLIMNALGYDAMALGNHEFNDGEDVLADFISGLSFPALAANVDFSAVPRLAETVLPWVVFDMGGDRVGVVGLVTPETPVESRPSPDIIFHDDLAGVTQAAVDALAAEGINKIILLSHLGLYADEPLAEQVSGIDIIVGGHSHNLTSNLYAADAGEYPMHKLSASGEPVLIVHAGSHAQFVGRLDVRFNGDGIIALWGGDVVHLSRFIPPDPDMDMLIASLREPLDALRETIVGQTATYLVGERSRCRAAECSFGNVVADALRAETGAQVGIISAGTLARSLPGGDIPDDPQLERAADLRLADIMEALPFQELVSRFELGGADLLAALEHSVAAVENESPQFLQVSGLRFSWDGAQPPGSRIVSVEIQADGVNYVPLDVGTTYLVASSNQLRQGNDGYSMTADSATRVYDFGRPLYQVVADYIGAHSPIQATVEGRITRLDPPPSDEG